MRRLAAGAALLAAASLVVSACGGDDAGGGTTGDGGTAGGQTLVQLDPLVAPSLNPDGAAGSNPGFMQTYVNLADNLVDYPVEERDGVLVPNFAAQPDEFTPSLAESYEQDGLVWTFKLREGVMSCFGNELTAEDVVYTFARAKSVTGTNPTADFVAVVGSVFTGEEGAPDATPAQRELDGEVVALDKYTVQITQHEANELFPKILTTWLMSPFDSVEMKKHATADDPWSHRWTETTNVATYGPYCLDSWTKGSEMTFTANPGYWRGTPQYTRVVTRQVPSDAQRLAGVSGGSANVATSLTPAEYNQAANGAGTGVISWDNPANFISLGINHAYEPFKDPEKGRLLRQAIAYAIPYEQIGQDVYFGKFTQATGNFPSDSFGFVAQEPYTTDLDKARELMAEAGYPNGEGLPADSTAFRLTYTAERSSTLQPLANLLRTSLNELGFSFELNPIPSAQQEAAEFSTHDLGSWLRDASRALVPDVQYSTLLYFASKDAGALVPSTNYANDRVDELYATAASTLGEDRQAAMTEIQEIVWDDLPLIPIGSAASQIAVSEGMSGWLGNSYDLVHWQYLKG